METADGTTGDGDAEHGEHGDVLGMMPRQPVGEFRHPSLMGEDADADAHGHHQQGKAENRIDAPNELVDGEDGGKDVVDEDDDAPPHRCGKESPPRGEGTEQTGGGDNEDGRHQDKQDDGEDTGEHQCPTPQFMPGNLG